MSQITMPKIKVLRTISKSSLEEPQYDKVEINCIECNKNKIQVSNYQITDFNDRIDSTNSLIKLDMIEYYYNRLCCDQCKEYLEDLISYFDNEEEEIKDRDQKLEIEYKNNARKTEPKSNKFVKRVLRSEKTYNVNKEKYVYSKNWNYVTKCDKSYPVEYHTLESITEIHKNCRLCKIINGSSKATKLNDYEVIHLFKHKIKLHKVRSNNYEYIHNIFGNCVLYHNSGIEAIIRKTDNKLIHNSQHWESGGGMYGSGCSCPYFDNAINLPLETITNEVFKRQDSLNDDIIYNINKIEILDQKNKSYRWNNNVLFKANNKYCWFKLDESHEYLIILPQKVSNINQANESLKPNILVDKKENKDYIRVGDYYFIETKEDFKQYDKFQREKCDLYHSLKYYSERYQDQYDQVKAKLIEYFPGEFKQENNIADYLVLQLLNNQDIESFIHRNKSIADQQVRRYKINEIINLVKKIFKPVKNGKLIRYDIYDSNHIADNSFYDKVQFVKGFIYHKNKDHSRRKLDKWNLVLPNEALRSWQVDPRRQVRGD